MVSRGNCQIFYFVRSLVALTTATKAPILLHWLNILRAFTLLEENCGWGRLHLASDPVGFHKVRRGNDWKVRDKVEKDVKLSLLWWVGASVQPEMFVNWLQSTKDGQIWQINQSTKDGQIWQINQSTKDGQIWQINQQKMTQSLVACESGMNGKKLDQLEKMVV